MSSNQIKSRKRRARKSDRRDVARLANKKLAIDSLESRTVLSATTMAIAGELVHSREHLEHVVSDDYSRYLSRSPDAAGLNYWADQLQNRGLQHEKLEAGFIGSQEYIDHHGGRGAGWVEGMYRDLLERSPDQSGRDYWVNQLNNGASPTTVALGFAASRERESNIVKDDYFNLLGRTASQDDINYWVNRFANGTSNDDIIAGFVGSDEYFHRSGGTHDDFLHSACDDVLGRGPHDDELEHWHDRLGTLFGATLRGSTAAHGKAEFQADSEDAEFEFEVEDAPVNQSFDLIVGGVTVARLTTNQFGKAEIKFDNSPDKPGETRFPANFPTISTGTTVQFGNLVSGSFSQIIV